MTAVRAAAAVRAVRENADEETMTAEPSAKDTEGWREVMAANQTLTAEEYLIREEGAHRHNL